MLVIERGEVTPLVACEGGGEAHHSGAHDADVHGMECYSVEMR